jgi:hypothetical protein
MHKPYRSIIFVVIVLLFAENSFGVCPLINPQNCPCNNYGISPGAIKCVSKGLCEAGPTCVAGLKTITAYVSSACFAQLMEVFSDNVSNGLVAQASAIDVWTGIYTVDAVGWLDCEGNSESETDTQPCD